MSRQYMQQGLCVVFIDGSGVVYKECSLVHLSAPYIPEYLAFREAFFFQDAFNKLKESNPEFLPQVLLIDGNGIRHPRGFGIASHVGVLLDLPTIGVAKHLFHVDGLEKSKEHKKKALRSTDKSSNPVFVSVGHKISLEASTNIVNQCCKFRTPEAVRQVVYKECSLVHLSAPHIYQGFGIASHVGVLLDLPTIGVAKHLFHVDGLEKSKEHKKKISDDLKKAGDRFELIGQSGKVHGQALKSTDKSSNPVFISVGHKISLETSTNIVNQCCKFRTPEAVRQQKTTTVETTDQDVLHQSLTRPSFGFGFEREYHSLSHDGTSHPVGMNSRLLRPTKYCFSIGLILFITAEGFVCEVCHLSKLKEELEAVSCFAMFLNMLWFPHDPSNCKPPADQRSRIQHRRMNDKQQSTVLLPAFLLSSVAKYYSEYIALKLKSLVVSKDDLEKES
eukprot:gene8796-9737_t